MSDSIKVALIGFLGLVAAALITAIASIYATNTQPETRDVVSNVWENGVEDAEITTRSSAEELIGYVGDSAGELWQSSWFDLRSPISMQEGDIIYIGTIGNAEKVLVRLLSNSSSPATTHGIEGGIRSVPSDRVLEVKLKKMYSNVKQISVHAGKEAFGYSLDDDNGEIKIVSVLHYSQ